MIAAECSKDFSGWAGPRNPKILVVGEGWSEQDEMCRQPFCGHSGQEFWRMLGEAMPDVFPDLHQQTVDMFKYGEAWVASRGAWLAAAGIAFTNVFNFRLPYGQFEQMCCSKKELPNGYDRPAIARALYVRPEFLPEVERLCREVTVSAPNLVICAGNAACWGLLSATNIGSIRGSVAASPVIEGLKCLPTFDPPGVMRQWNWRTVVVNDLMKAQREGEFPEIRRPRRQVLINPTMREINEWANETLFAPAGKYRQLGCDIETANGQITCIGFSRSRTEALVIPFWNKNCRDWNHWGNLQDELEAWSAVRTLLACPMPKLFQNGMYDLQYILKMGFKPVNCEHDSMLLHHSLFPEMKKGLGFLASIYSDEASWKLMRRKKPDTVKRDE